MVIWINMETATDYVVKVIPIVQIVDVIVMEITPISFLLSLGRMLPTPTHTGVGEK